MKKICTILSSLGATVPMVAYSICDQKNIVLNIESSGTTKNTESLASCSYSDNIWKDIEIKHDVSSDGEAIERNTQNYEKATAKIKWDNTISKSNCVNAHGVFVAYAGMESKYDNILKLKLDKKQTDKYKRVWVFEQETFDFGIRRGSSRIMLTLKAVYDSNESLTYLNISSYISVNGWHKIVISKIDKIEFLLNPEL